jgi:hypothetical protein
MFDDYGDGWNGFTLTVAGEQGITLVSDGYGEYGPFMVNVGEVSFTGGTSFVAAALEVSDGASSTSGTCTCYDGCTKLNMATESDISLLVS